VCRETDVFPDIPGDNVKRAFRVLERPQNAVVCLRHRWEFEETGQHLFDGRFAPQILQSVVDGGQKFLCHGYAEFRISKFEKW
jgi:hypothetical protein